MKLILAVAVSIPMLVAQTQRGPNLSVTAIRHWSQFGTTRIAVEVSGDFEFRYDRLRNPDRIYYDILKARPWIESRRSFTELLDDRLVKRIRVAETVPAVTRVVLDLGENAEVTASHLTNPNRLMIEVRAAIPPAEPAVTTAAPPTPEPAAVSQERPKQPAAVPQPVPAKQDSPKRTPAAPRPTPPKQEPPKLPPPAISVKPPVSATAGEGVTAEPSKAQLVRKTDTPPAAPAAGGERSETPALPDEIGKAARHTSAGQTSLVRALGLKINRVVIDPGHGGHDQGTQGPRGLLEKDVVLDIARRLGKLVEQRLGAEVIYTRNDDSFIPLEGRTSLANEKKADLFLSIHANSSPLSRTAGVETYYLNIKGSSQDALDVASRENASSQKSVFELQEIIQKIAKQDKAEESREFARRIQASLYAFSARNVAGAKNRGVRTAPFVVLIGANMPSVLAEVGFLSNPREEVLLKKPDYRQRLAESIFRGLSRYADSLSHFQMAKAGE